MLVQMLRNLVLALSLSTAPVAGLAGEAGDRTPCPLFVAGSQGLPTRGEWRTHPVIGDVNGDGHLDLAAHPRKLPGPHVWLGDGAGSWTEASRGLAVPGLGCGVGVDLADANGDGHLDLGIADHCSGLYLFLSDGKNEWRLAPLVNPWDRRGFEDLVFADLDRDGHQDMVAASTFRGGIVFFAGDGTGRFVERDVGLPAGGYAKDVKLGDVNGDGRLDVAATYSAGVDRRDRGAPRRNVVWLSDAEGRYARGSEGLPSKEGQFRGVALGDVNGDGWLDLALSPTYTPGRPPLLVYLGDGQGRWTPSFEGLPPVPSVPEGFTPFNGVELADLDRDGNLDLVATGYESGGIETFLGDGKGGWRACEDTGLPSIRENQRGWGVAVADVNHDGKPDIAAGFGRQGAGGLEVWLQR
jgi:hypothetical protein